MMLNRIRLFRMGGVSLVTLSLDLCLPSFISGDVYHSVEPLKISYIGCSTVHIIGFVVLTSWTVFGFCCRFGSLFASRCTPKLFSK